MVGKTFEVLVDGESKKNKDMLSGYAYNMKIIHFKGDPSLKGKLVKVKVTKSHLYSLLGELVSE